MTRRTMLMAGLSAGAGRAQEIYDLLLKGGHVIDPANRRNQKLDIAIIAGKIRRIAAGIPAAHSRHTVDVSEYYVTPGLVDLNMHIDPRTGVDADHNALRFGVTTAVDAGSAEAGTFERFKREVIDRSDTRVLAFLNAGSGAEGAAEVARKYGANIVGFHGSGDAVAPAVKAAATANTVVLAERAWSPAAAGVLRAGDIQSGMYSAAAQPDALAAARKRGILLDVGHGSGGLLFRVAAPAVKQGLLPDIISSGIDRESAMLPRATMTNVMSKFLALGMTLEQVIERTTRNPANAIRRPGLGAMTEQETADLAVFETRKAPVALLDSGHAKLMAPTEVRCVLTVRNGAVVWDPIGISLTDWRDAGPYSNFK